MKLWDLVVSKSALDFAYKLPLSSGAAAFRLRTLVEHINEYLKTYIDMQNDFIKSTGKATLAPEDPEYSVIIKKLKEAGEVDINLQIEPLIDEADFEGVKVSASVIDQLQKLGLINKKQETHHGRL